MSAMPRGFIGLMLTLVAMTGCVERPPLRAYPEAAERPTSVVILRHQTGFWNPSVYFVRIDGEPLPRAPGDRRPHFNDVELLPGKHEVQFGYEAALLGFQAPDETATVAFEAEVGHEYEARVQRSFWYARFGIGHWTGIIVDVANDAVAGTAIGE